MDGDAGLYRNLAAGLKETCLRFAGPAFPLHINLCFSKVIASREKGVKYLEATLWATPQVSITFV